MNLSVLAIFLSIVSLVVSAPVENNEITVESEYNERTDTGYSFAWDILVFNNSFLLLICYFCFRYTLSDGQTRTESGSYKDVGDTKVLVVSGSYTFTGTDGIKYYVSYESDENGYRATVDGNCSHLYNK